MEASLDLNKILQKQLEAGGWYRPLAGAFWSKDFQKLVKWLEKEYQEKTILPRPENIFRAFKLCPRDKARVVILGQDPYYTKQSATGLAFAVSKGCSRPPSLKNIFREIYISIGSEIPPLSSTLEGWASQGVLLINTIMTVEHGFPGSHAQKGWEEFTKAVLIEMSRDIKHNIFLLWGNHAKKIGKSIMNRYHNYIFEAGHPSSQSAKLFVGCGHFADTNKKLIEHGREPIDWSKVDTLEEPSYGEYVRERFF